MTQLSLQDALDRKAQGLARAEASAGTWVQRARAEAVRVAREKGSVHIDDLRAYVERTGDAPPSKYSWGTVFAERGRWRPVGLRASSVPSSHAHRSPVWALVEVA